jgi:hypothetical protein
MHVLHVMLLLCTYLYYCYVEQNRIYTVTLRMIFDSVLNMNFSITSIFVGKIGSYNSYINNIENLFGLQYVVGVS